MDTSVLADQQKVTFINSVLTLGVIKKTYQERWLIGMDKERESRESMLSAQLDDDDDYDIRLQKAKVPIKE